MNIFETWWGWLAAVNAFFVGWDFAQGETPIFSIAGMVAGTIMAYKATTRKEQSGERS